MRAEEWHRIPVVLFVVPETAANARRDSALALILQLPLSLFDLLQTLLQELCAGHLLVAELAFLNKWLYEVLIAG